MASIEKRTNKDGLFSYRVAVRKNGCKPQYASFKNHENAILWAKQIESALETRKLIVGYQDFLFQDVVKKYIEEHIPNLSAIEREKRISQVNFWADRFKDIFIKDITPEMIEKVLDDLSHTITIRNKKPISPKTVHRRLAALSHVFTIAIVKWKYLPVNPCTMIEKPDSKIIRTGNYCKAYANNEIVLYLNKDGNFKIKWTGCEIDKKTLDRIKCFID